MQDRVCESEISSDSRESQLRRELQGSLNLHASELHEFDVAYDYEAQLRQEQDCYWRLHGSEVARLTMLQQGLTNSEGLAEYYEQESLKLEQSAAGCQAVPTPQDPNRNAAMPAPTRRTLLNLMGSAVPAHVSGDFGPTGRARVGDAGSDPASSTMPYTPSGAAWAQQNEGPANAQGGLP